MFKRVHCPYCKQILKVIYSNKKDKILSCRCSKYPFCFGILYLQKNRLASRAIHLIEIGESESAALTLAHTRFLLSIPLRFLLLNTIRVSFKSFLRLFQLFSYDMSWSGYLNIRTENPYFKLSVLSTKSLGKNDKVLDLGCGVGQLFPYISEKCRGENIVGLDESFVSLLIARKFFTDPKTLLICGDAEKGLPFRESSLNIIIIDDVFHYIKGKFVFLKEMTRILYPAGLLFIIHTINGSGTLYENILAVKPETVFSYLKKLKYKRISIFPDSDIAYTVFASKRKLLNDVWIK